MTITSVDIVNRAIQLVGDNQPAVTGSGNYPDPIFDGSPAGIAATQFYVSVVNTVARQFGWDFSRNTVKLVNTGNAPPPPWQLEYLYPSMGIQIRQIMPRVPDPFNPLPIRWVVANDIFDGFPAKVILTNVDTAFAVFTNQPDENQWDSIFTESVVRLLANYFGGFIGRPDTARVALENAGMFTTSGEERVDN